MSRILNGNSWKNVTQAERSLRADAPRTNMLRYPGNSQEDAQAERTNAVGELVGKDGVDDTKSCRP